MASPFPSRNRLKARAELRSKKFGLIAALTIMPCPNVICSSRFQCLRQAITGNSGQSLPPQCCASPGSSRDAATRRVSLQCPLHAKGGVKERALRDPLLGDEPDDAAYRLVPASCVLSTKSRM